jgi:hypothetical protein
MLKKVNSGVYKNGGNNNSTPKPCYLPVVPYFVLFVVAHITPVG